MTKRSARATLPHSCPSSWAKLRESFFSFSSLYPCSFPLACACLRSWHRLLALIRSTLQRQNTPSDVSLLVGWKSADWMSLLVDNGHAGISAQLSLSTRQMTKRPFQWEYGSLKHLLSLPLKKPSSRNTRQSKRDTRLDPAGECRFLFASKRSA